MPFERILVDDSLHRRWRPEASRATPWAASLCVILAIIGFAATDDTVMKAVNGNPVVGFPSPKSWAPMLVAVLLILSARASRMRLPSKGAILWVVRFSVYALVLGYTYAITQQIQSAYYMNFTARVFGYCFVFESAIQHWIKRQDGDEHGGFLVFLAAIIFVLASRTYTTHVIKYLTPPFIVLLVLSMRSARQRDPRSESATSLWLFAMLLGLMLGGSMALGIAANSSALSRIVLSLMRPKVVEDFTEVNTRPVLGRSLATAQSQTRVMKIEGELREHHFRGMAFELYLKNGAWAPAENTRSRPDSGILRALPGGERLTVYPLLENIPFLYVPLHMAGVDAKDYALQWSSEWNGSILASPRTSGSLSYQIAVANEVHEGPLVRAKSDLLLQRCLELPDDFDPRIRELAEEIAGKFTDRRDKMEAIRRYLWNNHNYSLNIEPGPGDPAANFLLKKLDGHCQYFASASVLLLRSMNVPARYVTGYYAHESPQTGEWILRQRDAHAWVEVWIESDGWVTFDTTPSSGMPGQSGGVSWWSRLMERVVDWAESVGVWLREAPYKKVSVILLVIGLGIYVIIKMRSWRAANQALKPRVHYESAGMAFDLLEVAFESYLKRCGAACPSHTPWADHLSKLRIAEGKTSPERDQKAVGASIRWDEADAFVRRYSSARFGGNVSPDDLRVLQEILRKLNS